MQFSPVLSIFDHGKFLRESANNPKKNSSVADELIFSFGRLAIWMTAPCVLFVYGLLGFLEPDFKIVAQNSVFYTLFPGTVISIWLSYRGEMKHLLYGMVFFEFSTALSWGISATGSSSLTVAMNYYIILPIVAPIIVGTIIIFCIYPVPMMIANLAFFSFIIGFPFLVDPNAYNQMPAFVSFIGAVLVMGIFVYCVSHITTVLYASIAETEEKQTALSQVQSIINDGLDAAPFGLLCYKDNGELLIERGVSAYFPDRRDIKTLDSLYQYLEAKCGIDLDAAISNSVQVEISDRPSMITRKHTGSIAVFSFVDMTERQQWEERALRAEKLGLIGQITSGITHDYNNSLAVAISSIERVSRDEHKQVWDEHLDLAFNALDQAREISKKLLNLSGARNLKFVTINVDKTIMAMSPLLNSVVPDQVEVRVYSKVKKDLFADGGELEAALLNLVINAKNAIGSDNGIITLNTSVEGDDLVIQVRDNGPGIPKAIRRRIFDPFFSTRKGRNSSGMGLTTVKSFMEGSGGTIQVVSCPGNTIFELRFPLDHTLVPTLPETDFSKYEELEEDVRVEKILLIDDNIALLEVMAELVELQNVSCLIAGNACEARKIMNETKDIDAVFIDLSMPDINGIDLGGEFLEKYPKCRYYLLTGERLTEKTEHATDHGFRGVFFKPLRVGELLEAAAT